MQTTLQESAQVVICIAIQMLVSSIAHAAAVTWDASCGTSRWLECCPVGDGSVESNWNKGSTQTQACPILLMPTFDDDVQIGSNDVLLDCCTIAQAQSLATQGGFTVQGGFLNVLNSSLFAGDLLLDNAALRSGLYRAESNLTIRGANSQSGLRLEEKARFEIAGDGTIEGTSTAIFLSSGSSFTIEPGAVLSGGLFQRVTHTVTSQEPVNFDVRGEFRVAGGTSGDFLMGPTCAQSMGANCGFHNHGLVTVESGKLSILTSGEDAGNYWIVDGGQLRFGGNVRTISGNVSLLGNGAVEALGTTFSLNTGASMRITNLTGTCQFNSTSSSASVEVENSLNTTNMMLSRPTMRIGPAAVATLLSPRLLNSRIEVDGILNMSGSASIAPSGSASRIEVNENGLLDITGLQSVLGSSTGSPQIIVNGVLRKGGLLGGDILTPTHVAGRVEVTDGQLRLRSPGTYSGTFDVAPGAMLILNNGIHQLLDGAVLTGGGTINANGSGSLVTRVETGASVLFDSVSLTGQLTVLGEARFAGTCPNLTATLSGNGDTVIEPEAQVVIPLLTTLASHRLRNHGLISLNGQTTLRLQLVQSGVPAIFVNEADGVVDFSFGGRIFLGPGSTNQVVNKGLFRLNGPGGADLPGILMNEGTIEVLRGNLRIDQLFTQSAGGAIILDGGTLGSATGAPVTLAGGRITGNGPLTFGKLVNAGATIEPGLPIGGFKLTGFQSSSYEQGPGGTLAIDIAGSEPQVGHDVLKVGGTATLGGTLRVTRVGDYLPQGGEGLTILEFAERIGKFEDVELVGFPKGTRSNLKYYPDHVLLSVATPN